jgi:hypothetical protein
VVGFYDDILVVPWDVEDADTGNEGNAGDVNTDRLRRHGIAYAPMAKGNSTKGTGTKSAYVQ